MFNSSMGDIFQMAEPAWQIVLRCIVVYVVVLAGLRVSGKREIGQLTIFDLVVLLLLANGVQNAMVGADTSLTGGLLAAATLLVVNALFAQATVRSTRLRRVLQGTPTVLVLHGEPVADNMKREGISDDEFEAALREHGVSSIKDVDMAVLELDGSISVVPLGQTTKRVKHPVKYLRHA